MEEVKKYSLRVIHLEASDLYYISIIYNGIIYKLNGLNATNTHELTHLLDCMGFKCI